MVEKAKNSGKVQKNNYLSNRKREQEEEKLSASAYKA